jgi:septum formation protein
MPTKPLPDFVYLASQSPRRVQLLDQLGVPHRLLLPAADEDAEALEAERPGELPRDYVERVTLAKLAAARRRLRQRALPQAPILVADTTVALGRRILGKPRDAADATCMLQALAGRTHRVLTAVAVGAGTRRWLAVNVSRVHVAPMSAQAIARYVASGEPMGKAGAYGIQGAIAAWVQRIDGSHSGIMGLPLYETAQLLGHAGVRTGP